MIAIQPQTCKDELLSSWVIRCAIATGSDPSSWAWGVWFDYRVWTRDIDRTLPEDKLLPLAAISSIPSKELKNLTLEPLLYKIHEVDFMNPKKAWPWVIPTGTRNRTKTNGLHFCPLCLAQEPVYYKKQWRLAWNVGCSDHHVLLAIRCPKCHSAFSPHLVEYTKPDITLCHKCGYDLKNMKTPHVDNKVIKLQEAFNGIFEGKAPSVFAFDNSFKHHFDTLGVFLRFFRSKEYVPSVAKLADWLLPGHEKLVNDHMAQSLESLDVSQRYILMKLASALYSLPMEHVLGRLSSLGIHRSILNPLKVSTPTIDYICSELDSVKKREYTSRQSSKKVIRPKSKEEVERLMEKIRMYL